MAELNKEILILIEEHNELYDKKNALLETLEASKRNGESILIGEVAKEFEKAGKDYSMVRENLQNLVLLEAVKTNEAGEFINDTEFITKNYVRKIKKDDKKE